MHDRHKKKNNLHRKNVLLSFILLLLYQNADWVVRKNNISSSTIYHINLDIWHDHFYGSRWKSYVSHVAFKRLYTAICTGCTETSSNAHWRNEKLKVITFKYSVCPIGALVLATPPTFLSPLSEVQTNKETKKKLWKHKIQPFVCTILNLWVRYLGSCHVVVWSQTKG